MEDSGLYGHPGMTCSLWIRVPNQRLFRSQVPLEEVLNDKNGLHLEAGPFFLIYSRSLSGPHPSEPPEASVSSEDLFFLAFSDLSEG